jgi:hypothetical protein
VENSVALKQQLIDNGRGCVIMVLNYGDELSE